MTSLILQESLGFGQSGCFLQKFLLLCVDGKWLNDVAIYLPVMSVADLRYLLFFSVTLQS